MLVWKYSIFVPELMYWTYIVLLVFGIVFKIQQTVSRRRVSRSESKYILKMIVNDSAQKQDVMRRH